MPDPNEHCHPNCPSCAKGHHEQLLPDLSRGAAMRLAAHIARRGLHDLMPYWSPDIDADLDPLDDPETKAEVRRFIGQINREAMALVHK